jgi:porphobilinogen synthase
MVRETRLEVSDMIAPLFVVPGEKVQREISSMPGQYNLSVDTATEKAITLYELGIRSVLLFAIPEFKDDVGSSAWHPQGIIPKAIKSIKKAVPDMMVVTLGTRFILRASANVVLRWLPFFAVTVY